MMRFIWLCLAVVLSCSTRAAPAEDSARPVWIIVPYAPGGAVDIISRMLARDLTTRLGRPVIVDNKPGAGGNLGSAFVAKSKPDGATLVMGGPFHTIAHRIFDNLTYDPLKDLVPVAMIGAAPSVLLVSPELDVRDLAGLVRLAREARDPLTYGHGGAGTTSEHLVAELFQQRADIRLTAVPYKGGAQAMQDLMANRITLMFTNLLNALPHIRSGRLKALAIAQAQRAPAIPDVPTFAESGFPDFNAQVWWGLMGPANMPPSVVETINREVNTTIQQPEFVQKLVLLGAQVVPLSVDQFAAQFDAERLQWEQTAERAGLAPQP